MTVKYLAALAVSGILTVAIPVSAGIQHFKAVEFAGADEEDEDKWKRPAAGSNSGSSSSTTSDVCTGRGTWLESGRVSEAWLALRDTLVFALRTKTKL